MKKIEKTLLITFILLLFYFTKDINMLSLTISFSMYLLFYCIFSTTSLKNIINEFNYKKDHHFFDKVFKYSLISILLLGIIIGVISYFIGNILNIDKINLINIFMALSLTSNVILKLTSEYLDIIGYKKIGNNLVSIYNSTSLSIGIVLIILLFKVFKLDNYINISLLYSVSIIVFIIIIVLLYILIFKKKRIDKKKICKNNINYISQIKRVLVGNKIETIFNIIKYSYNYISIIVLYYVLAGNYNYSLCKVGMLITNTYFYGLIIVYILYKIILKYLKIDYNNINNNFVKIINKIIKLLLYISVLLIVISIPFNNILFGSEYNFISYLVPLLFFYILYIFVMNVNIKYNKNKNVIIILLVGLFVKVIFEIPFINTIYRMGYSLILGSIFSTILGFIISIIIGLFLINKKFKINILDGFNELLNMIYESIIYTFILVVFTLVVKLDNTSLIINVLVIIFYIFITILFYIIKKRMKKR